VDMAYLKVGHHTVIPLAQLRMLVPGLEPGIWQIPHYQPAKNIFERH